jgi:hypothetical protein
MAYPDKVGATIIVHFKSLSVLWSMFPRVESKRSSNYGWLGCFNQNSWQQGGK